MNTTSKALIFGTAVAALGLGAAVLMLPKAPVVKLEPVVVTAQRAPVAQVVRFATVEVTASRAQAVALSAQEQTKQAAAASEPRI